jgi:hypothetical protein
MCTFLSHVAILQISFDRRYLTSPFLNDNTLIVNYSNNTIYDFLELDILVDCDV